jgi:hypothetical protein
MKATPPASQPADHGALVPSGPSPYPWVMRRLTELI